MKTFTTLLLLFFSLSTFSKSPRVVFISPDPKNSKNEFWRIVTKNILKTAQDLGVNLEVIYTESHHTYYYEAIRKVASRKDDKKPDYFVGLLLKHYSIEILDLLERAKIKSLFVNMNIAKEERIKVGYPREKYKFWIGHFFPDDYYAGHLVTKEVAKKCRGNNKVVSISGTFISNASLDRHKAFVDISKEKKLNLLQNFNGSWEKEIVKKMMPHIEARYPDFCGFLVASDWMAEGIIENTNKSYHICSIDWTSQGLKNVINKKFLCSIGGHFLEPSFALVALFDYHNGIDFKDDIGLTYKSSFYVATSENAQDIYNRYYLNKKTKNFKQLSKFYSEIKKYNFNIK